VFRTKKEDKMVSELVSIEELDNIKKAATENPVHEIISKRWSPRAFNGQSIPEKDLHTIFESASWAFSSMNYQPWRYVYAQKSDENNFNLLLDCLVPFNQEWAKNASVIILSLAKKKYDDGKLNFYAPHDVGAANATLALQAQSMGIYSHLMGGFDKNKTIQNLNIDSEEYEPVVLIALGYVDSPEKLTESLAKREIAPRKRKAVSEITREL
jgi:nitroreductase